MMPSSARVVPVGRVVQAPPLVEVWMVPRNPAPTNSPSPKATICRLVAVTVGEVTATEAKLTFTMPADGQVELSAFDVAGRRLATIENGVLSKGVYERAWSMADVPKGLYFVRLRASGVTLSKMVLKVR